MSQENTELARRLFDAVNERDLGAYLALMDDDVVARPRVVGVEGEAYQGHEGIRRWWGDLVDIFPDSTLEVVEERELGDLVFGALYFRARGASGSTPVDETIWNVGRWRHGKCIWWRTFQTRAEALETVGVETVQRVYEEVTARLEAPEELFAPEMEFDVTEVAPDIGEILRGPQAVNEALHSYWATFEEFHVEIEELVHADEGLVITAVRDGGQMKGSDAEVWNRFFHVWTLGDGGIVRLSIHTEKARALEAAGRRA
jgi:ketosteroid isomerase-like protein